jgi:hypothetical protein
VKEKKKRELSVLSRTIEREQQLKTVLFKKVNDSAGRVAQVVEDLLSKPKILHSSPNTTTKKKKVK